MSVMGETPQPPAPDPPRHGRWPGLFITFEGGDGVGKSTQINRLRGDLTKRGHDCVLTREPGGTPGAEEIRDLLVTGAPDRWSALTEAFLLQAARADHLERRILPALKAGRVVLCDRFIDSTMAYQGHAGSLGPTLVDKLQALCVGQNLPDITIVLTLAPDQALVRATARNQDEDSPGEARFEARGASFQTAVDTAFRKIAADNPDRCVLIDAGADESTVADRIRAALSARLPAGWI